MSRQRPLAERLGMGGAALLFCACLFLLAWQALSWAAENRFEADIRQFEQQDRQQPPPQHAVLFTGSSSIVRWTTLQEDFAGYEVLNRGFGGAQFSDLSHFFDRVILPYQPRVIVIYAGSHDLHLMRVSPEDLLRMLKTFRDRVRTALPETKIFYLSMKPSILKWADIALDREANRLIQAYAQETQEVEFIDIWTPMLAQVADGSPPPEKYFAPDLNHLNREGYRLWAAVIRRHLETPAIGSVSAADPAE